MAFLEDPITRLRDLVSRFGLVFVFNRYYSLYRAQVVTSTDPENQGRVRVICPAVSKTGVLDWAYPVSLMGGTNRGLFFPPDKDDYVIVGFEEGNTKHPFYLGGWWKKDDLPEEMKHEDKKPPTVRGIVTPGGHQLLFTDTEDKLEILLKHKDGAKLTFLKNKSVEVETPAGNKLAIDDENKKIEVKDANDNTVVMDSNGVKISTSKDVVIDKAANCNIKAGNVTIADGADNAAVRGDDLKSWLEQHTHPSAVGPTGPPTQAATLTTTLSQKVKLK